MTNNKDTLISNDCGTAVSDIYIRATHLNIGYREEVIVRDINFDLSHGEAIALIGTNGSGKTTLLKTIMGLLEPMGGDLSVFNMPTGNNHRRIAYLGQFHNSGFVLPIRAIDVVRMGRYPLHGIWHQMGKKDDEIVMAAMRAIGVEQLAKKSLRSLSGGQKQRIYLAQVLAHEADLLVMDEPTTGLDAGGRELFLNAINDELCRGASVIMATHDIQEEAALCHHVMLLARKVVAIGPPDKVMTSEALLETFGVVVAGGNKFHVLECKHGHDDNERWGLNRDRKP
jgi:ABC-type Mn2+/Zn2+ transport system ATPase subunit